MTPHADQIAPPFVSKSSLVEVDVTGSAVPDWNRKQQEVWQQIAEREPRHVLLYGGSRSGKTYMVIFSILLRAMLAPRSTHLVARLHHNAVRKTLLQGTFAEVIRDRFPRVRVQVNLSDSVARLPNGSEIHFSGLDSEERVEKLLGMEFSSIYLNECSQIPWGVVPLIRSRLAQRPTYRNSGGRMAVRMFYDLNPSGSRHWTAQEFLLGKNPSGGVLLNRDWYLACQVNPKDNPLLSADYLAELDAMDSRRRSRFLLGEFVDDVAGALWSSEDIDRNRVLEPPALDRLCVAVDPSLSGAETSDEAGIVAVGASSGQLFVLADESGRMGPSEWAKKAIDLYWSLNAGCIVAEKNQGGEMVRVTLNSVDSRVPVVLVDAIGDKASRAVPVANLYRKGFAHHVGRLDGLEDEMVSWDPDPPRGSRRWSPGRIDALVHGARFALPHVLGVRISDSPVFSGSVERRVDSSLDFGVPTFRDWTAKGGL
ncbi:Phage terminase large subunit [uncultured Caudovirales phage]|uniref:Phage terminase large subunit n=1 Tax=uncultured Caudovirales phage TaxID=2100421 RepID=A0A6J5MUC6_9CAUD|nr:Phage terminase large subunit [uncultured Caudovirales phage]